MIPFEQTNQVALANFVALVPQWLPSGRRRGDEWVIGDLSGAPGDSLSINLRTGKWADFATGDRGGDPISLYAAIHTNGDRVSAARALARLLAVTADTLDTAPVHTLPPSPEWEPLPVPADVDYPSLSAWDHVYVYRDADGRPQRYVVRNDATELEKKKIRAVTYGRLDGRIGWHMRHAASPRSLYALDRISNHQCVLVCEGEKAADAAQALFPKIAATTWTGGTGNVALSDWSVLSGKRVLIWPDNDDPGLKAASQIVSILSNIADSVRVLDVSALELGADAADLSVSSPKDWLQEHLGPVIAGTSVKRARESSPVHQISRRAAGLEPIQIRAGEVDLQATAAERALIAANAPVYQRGTSLVRPGRMEVSAAGGKTTVAACLVEMNPSSMTDMLCQSVEWQKYNKRSEAWIQTDPPASVAQIVMARAGAWSFPSIAGVITTPTLRPDGSVLMAPGYDKETRLYHVDDPTLELNLPNPTRDVAEGALSDLDALLEEFPFASRVDRSVALAALITPVVRGMMPTSPMFAFRAHAPGSGKSYLVHIASAIATGRYCQVMTAGETSEEMEKRLDSVLLAGSPIFSIDNVNGELGGNKLCQAIEQPLVGVRPLGKTITMEVENRSVAFATGNNLTLVGDMTRRVMLCTLDAGMERPETRQFKFDPVNAVLADRGRYIAACLTIIRAFLISGEAPKLEPLASFEKWTATVRSALVWLGHPDPALSISEAREDDPETSELREFIALVSAAKGTGVGACWSARELAEMSAQDTTDQYGYRTGLKYPDLRDCLLRITKSKNGAVNTKSLGSWLRARKGRRIGESLITHRGEDRNGVAIWSVGQ